MPAQYPAGPGETLPVVFLSQQVTFAGAPAGASSQDLHFGCRAQHATTHALKGSPAGLGTDSLRKSPPIMTPWPAELPQPLGEGGGGGGGMGPGGGGEGGPGGPGGGVGPGGGGGGALALQSGYHGPPPVHDVPGQHSPAGG